MFVGIYAYRYGWIPPGELLSVTEQEFDYAGSKGIPRLCYLVDDSLVWPPDQIEHAAADKIAALRDKVSSLVLSTFRSPEDLATSVAADLHRVIVSELASKPIAEPVRENLPRRRSLVGRETPIQTVRDHLDDGESVVAVVGAPGVGKTSVAINVAHYCRDVSDASRARFQAFVWHTRKPRPVTITSLCNAIAEVVDYPFVAGMSGDKKRRETRRLLARFSALIVVDDLNPTVNKSEADVMAFLADLPAGSQAVVTSRDRTFQYDTMLILEPLNEQASLELIRAEALRRSLTDVATSSFDSRMLSLVRATSGNPLAVEWALGQVANGRALNLVVTQLQDGRADIFDTLFVDSWARFPQASRSVLTSLSLAGDCTWNGLRALTGLDDNTIQESLTKIQQASLLIVEGGLDQAAMTFGLHPLTATFVGTRIQDPQSARDALLQKGLTFYEPFSAQRRPSLAPSSDSVELSLEIELILLLVDWSADSADWDSVLRLFGGIEELLLILGRFDDRVRYSELAARGADSLHDSHLQAHYLTLVGGTLVLTNEFGKANIAIDQALLVARAADDKAEESRAIRTRALILYRQGHREDALGALTPADDLALEAGDALSYCDVLDLRANVLFSMDKFEQSKDTFAQLATAADSIGWELCKAYALRGTGDLARVRGDLDGAQQSLDLSLELTIAHLDRRHMARLKLSYAKLWFDKDDAPTARVVATEALDEFDRMGMWNERHETSVVLKAIDRFSRKPWSFGRNLMTGRGNYSKRPIAGD